MPPAICALSAFVLLEVLFTAVWAWQIKSHNAGMIDPVWAFSLGAVALLYGFMGTGSGSSRTLVALAGALWGARLGTHLWRRNWRQPEDARYRRFREEWGPSANVRMFWLFQLQVLVSMILSLAFAVPSYRSDGPTPFWIVVALSVWVISTGGEALADRQLSRFGAKPRNCSAVCRDGLWRYSRHPNYFFECMHWVTYIALSIGSPWAWLTLAPPLLMTWLLMKLSGVPLLEQRSLKTRPGYEEYMQVTSPFVPWPPRKRPRSRV